MNMLPANVRQFSALLLLSVLTLNLAYAQADYATSAEVHAQNRVYDRALLAPDGNHFALLANVNGEKALMILNVDSLKPVAAMASGSGQEILNFWWANNERVVVNLALRGEYADYPLLTGELFALNIDNTRKFAVAGFSAGDSADYKFLDPMPGNEREIRVIRSDIKNRRSEILDLSRPTAYTLDIYKRYRQTTGTNLRDGRLENKYASPYETGGFVTDNTGELRLAWQVDRDGMLKVSERNYETDEWVEAGFAASLHPERQAGSQPIIGFDSKNQGIFYFGLTGNNTVGLFHHDLDSGQTRALVEPEQVDLKAADLIRTSDHDVVGVYLAGKPTPVFFDKSHKEAGKLSGLAKAFKGSRVEIINYSANGEYALVDVKSAGSEAGLYLFDTQSNSVSILMSANS